jgi:replicative DNA helicase Mcm
MSNELPSLKWAEFATKFRMFIEKKHKKDVAKAIERDSTIEIDFSQLDIFNPKMADLLLGSPDTFLDISAEVMNDIDPINEIKVKFFNSPLLLNIRNIRSKHIGKLITIEGFVRKASDVKPEIVEKVFLCRSCSEIIKQPSKNTVNVAKCRCGSKNLKQGDHEKIDVRWITVEESFEATEGEKPSQLHCFLCENLVLPANRMESEVGNRIRITGILREIPKEKASLKLDFYLEAIHIMPMETGWEHLEMTKEEEEKIKEIAAKDDAYEILIDSFAPSLYGLRDIKEAVILQFFGGIHRAMPDGNHIRGDIHCLIIGDASTGKSQILKIASEISPRSRYVSGKGSTTAGLTAAVTKDELLTGGWVLEAGALVLCNKGLLCVDEFEKMTPEDQTAFHEAMEQQTVSVSKATITATLPARTAILAGGNPKLSRFDDYIPIAKQINIPDTLLSRFDLKFVLKDKPNAENDRKLLKHVLSARRKGEETKPKLSPNFIRKYVSFAKEHCFPEMTEEAEDLMMDFYLKMRKMYEEKEKSIAITLRQFEALIRLAEASAKIQLSQTVRVKDAERAIRIMNESLIQIGYDPETKKIDADRADGSISASERKKIMILMDIINEMALESKEIRTEDLKKKADLYGLKRFDEALDNLKLQGLVYMINPVTLKKV